MVATALVVSPDIGLADDLRRFALALLTLVAGDG